MLLLMSGAVGSSSPRFPGSARTSRTPRILEQ
ncbi:hypothetical protein, partial [Gordonia alkanivorans]